jgi:biopolymer transport protein ExbD
MKKLARHKTQNTETELNLNPMMDIFVGLVPILLVTASFSHYAAVQTSLPGKEVSQSNEKPPAEVRLTFEVQDQFVVVSGFDSGFDKPVPGLFEKFPTNDLVKLKQQIEVLKGKYPKFGPSLFFATGSTPYQTVISVLDLIKTTMKGSEVILAAGVVE